MNKENLINFSATVDYYLTKATRAEKDEEHLKALDYVCRAERIEPSKIISLRKACCYENMELYEQANNIYYEILGMYENDDDTIYTALFENSILDSNINGARVNANLCAQMLNKGEDKSESTRDFVSAFFENNEEIEDFLENVDTGSQSNNIKLVPDWAKYKSTSAIKKAKMLLDNDEIKKAIEILKHVNTQAMDYVEAQRLLCLCYLCEKEYEKTIEIAEELLKIEEDSLSLLLACLESYKRLGKHDQAKIYVNKIYQFDDLSLEFAEAVVEGLVITKEHEGVLKYANRLLNEYNPYDIDLLRYKAIALFNIGKYEESAEIFYILMKLFDPHNVCLVYRKMAIQMCLNEKNEYGVQELSYNCSPHEIPMAQMQEYLDKIIDVCAMKKEELIIHFKEDGYFVQALEWMLGLVMTSENSTFIARLVLTKDEKIINFLKKQLLRGYVDTSVQKCIAYMLMRFSNIKQIKYLYADKVCEYNIPNKIISSWLNKKDSFPPVFIQAYHLAISEIMFVCEEVLEILFDTLVSIYEEYVKNKCDFRSPEALACLIVISSPLAQIMTNKEVCELFNCSQSTVGTYMTKLKIKD